MKNLLKLIIIFFIISSLLIFPACRTESVSKETISTIESTEEPAQKTTEEITVEEPEEEPAEEFVEDELVLEEVTGEQEEKVKGLDEKIEEVTEEDKDAEIEKFDGDEEKETITSSDLADNLYVHFIDVWQGDSILIDLGSEEVLIDGGGKSPGVTDYIREYIDGPLEVIIATHPHADHIGGLIDVLGSFDVEVIWHNGDTSTSQTYTQFMNAVKAEGVEINIARRGDKITIKGLTFMVLNPAALAETTNNNSIVLSLSYGEVDFFFAGDAEREAEKNMLDAHIVPNVEILKVGHHGSKTASSFPFLEVAQPEIAIYMAGEGNRYDHPHDITLNNLSSLGIKIYGTDKSGNIIIETDGLTYSVLEGNPFIYVEEKEQEKEQDLSQEQQTEQTQEEEQQEEQQTYGIEVVSLTSPISRGAQASITIKTAPNVQCSITVYYKSGASKAKGLEPKNSDENGNCTWSWKVLSAYSNKLEFRKKIKVI